MTRQGSSKPCPGCGEVYNSRRADEICMACKSKLKRFDRLEAEYAKLQEDKIVVAFASASHWNEHISHASSFATSLKKDIDILDTLHHLATLLITPVDKEHKDDDGTLLLGKLDIGVWSGSTTKGMLNPEVAKTIIRLRKEIATMLDFTYKEGVRKGTRLLTGLADGTYTDIQFNEKVQHEVKDG